MSDINLKDTDVKDIDAKDTETEDNESDTEDNDDEDDLDEIDFNVLDIDISDVNNVDEDSLKSDITLLKKILDKKTDTLFKYRFYKFIKLHEFPNITDITFDIDINTDNNNWSITYTHDTNNYSSSNYNYLKCNKIVTTEQKTTTITFGRNGGYFIMGNNDKFRVYKNKNKKIRVLNESYESKLDIEDQRMLMDRYIENKDIPEWLAIYVFNCISNNEWEDEHFIIHLSVVG